MKYVIGVDSGGSHIVGQALEKSGKVIFQTQSGPGNIFLDQENTYQNLTTVLTEIFAHLDRADCQHILIGIAGVETTNNASEVATDFTEKFGVKTDVISDAQLALLNGLEGQDGTLVIAGTGSVVYGRQNKNMIRYGGWGFLLGDTGSAYKITEQAVKQILKQHDLQQSSELSAPLLQLFGAEDVKQAVQKYYALSRKDIAAFAVKIAELATTGSVEAQTVLTDQATALADEVLGLYAQYQQPIPERIAFSGSVLVHNDFYRHILLAHIQEQHPNVTGHVVSTNNGRGAIFWDAWQ
ncbi:N-acetylglucosamine kinase [Lapidilactobacillus mulanensis]|uniref:N-acetylglucosamine kinase n=1 Tax=Lapidilactobacillus mulanensis TaxID=2485999 RepID=A0ABW4DME6_9LACO|nr:BadF/BadG/BcrA/BcrD ATPase family protein [Lapidilactobacillus mulanensis]